ncbi:hypothetical protein CR513_20155, partial [Mucuna pruriens]
MGSLWQKTLNSVTLTNVDFLYTLLSNQFLVERTVQQMIHPMERIAEDPLVCSYNSPWIVAGEDEYSKERTRMMSRYGLKSRHSESTIKAKQMAMEN